LHYTAFYDVKGARAGTTMRCATEDKAWHIYTFFALPRVANDGLNIKYTVVDLVAIKLVGGDAGLGDFWGRWHDCVARVRSPPNKDDYEYVFVDEMRETKLMANYIRD
jgi:hypothetical protein